MEKDELMAPGMATMTELQPPKKGSMVKLKWIEPKSAPMIPRRATSGASGFDLMAFGDYELELGKPQLIRTGWQIEIEPGFEGQIRARSGLALKHGIIVPNGPGTIDCDYRGELGVIMLKVAHGKPFPIHHGDRIAQLVITQVYTGDIDVVMYLTETVRGAQGYGSTGV